MLSIEREPVNVVASEQVCLVSDDLDDILLRNEADSQAERPLLHFTKVSSHCHTMATTFGP